MISIGEVIRWGRYALFGVAMWLIYQGIFNVISEYGLTSMQSVFLGLGIVFLMLITWKFRSVMFR